MNTIEIDEKWMSNYIKDNCKISVGFDKEWNEVRFYFSNNTNNMHMVALNLRGVIKSKDLMEFKGRVINPNEDYPVKLERFGSILEITTNLNSKFVCDMESGKSYKVCE